MQEEKDKVQAQKEEVLSHMNDVLENELQCIICSEYFIELSRAVAHPTPSPSRCTRQPLLLIVQSPSYCSLLRYLLAQLALNHSESLAESQR